MRPSPSPPLATSVLFVLVLCAAGWGGLPVLVAAEPPAATTPAATTPGPSNAVALAEVRPGVWQLGSVLVDKTAHTISFPAELNLAQGPMEYLLVTTQGKVHESILRTSTDPYLIHVGLLLLGATPAGTNDPARDPAFTGPAPFISHPAKTRLPGDPLRIEVSWTARGTPIHHPAGELVFNQQLESVLPDDVWVHNGSRVWRGNYLAQLDGSVISLVTDPDALINNTGLGHDNDAIWTANTNCLPPKGVPLRLTIRLSDSPTKP